ncbi:MAG: metalloregulator ArsR/SmtB family transcription factor [Acidimicrobiia bacterium]|nr:metalloregulator ArsR/SmtB family transcription factor [Acidimicrobiia bacterium]MBV8985053.1 metalloregulator ArsR/SmtB family transcription factor [Acidimicrobiia bacterium]MBV9039509.1 metalloregulator ArsR/SmtB family transcription factor [Acidimicrobiia bacterium]
MRDIDKVLAALRSPIRREILGLVWARELAAGEIATAFALTKPTISQHLSVLREAGLVRMTAEGTFRRYAANQDALDGLHAALEGARKWTPADEITEGAATQARTTPAVVVAVDVDTDQETTFRAFTDPETYSRWLGVPVTIKDGRFAATMEWGTEVRGIYDAVCPPQLLAMRWDFEDDNVPVPGRELIGYLRVESTPDGSHVEVHQLVRDAVEADFMEAAWGLVLGRFKQGVSAASKGVSSTPRRRRRPKYRSSA